MRQAKEITENWANRRLSLVGKVQVINTLIASLFVYKMMVLPRIPDSLIAQMNEIFNKFIWAGHKPKIDITV